MPGNQRKQSSEAYGGPQQNGGGYGGGNYQQQQQQQQQVSSANGYGGYNRGFSNGSLNKAGFQSGGNERRPIRYDK